MCYRPIAYNLALVSLRRRLMQDDLLTQGLVLMVAGMGTVFVFLTILVAAMTLMSRLLMRLHVIEVPAEPGADEVAAITAAIAEHRRQR